MPATAAWTAAAAASRSSRVTAASKLKRTAVWATSAGTPMAVSTADGASEPAAHAEPLEQTTPRRSSSKSTDSPPVPGKQNEATDGSRSDGCPVRTASGTPASTAAMNRSRSAATLGRPQLVPRDAHRIHPQRAGVERQPAGGLDGVGVERDAVGAGRVGQSGAGLDGAYLV